MNGWEGTVAGFVLGFGVAFVLVEPGWKQQAKRKWWRLGEKQTPFDRQVELWQYVKEYDFLLSADERELFDVLKIRLDAGLELHPMHETKLIAMHQRIHEHLAW